MAKAYSITGKTLEFDKLGNIKKIMEFEKERTKSGHL